MRIVFELKQDANPQVVLNQLYRFSSLQETVGGHHDRAGQQTAKGTDPERNAPPLHRVPGAGHYPADPVRSKKAQERAHILEGLKIALDFIDEVIAILRSCKTIPEGKQALIDRFNLT